MRKNGLVLVVGIVFVMIVYSVITFGKCPFLNFVCKDKGNIVNDVCPVMSGKVEEDTIYTAEYKGIKVGFCCKSCIKTFKEDPEKYMQNIEKKCIIKCPKCGTEIDLAEECKKANSKKTGCAIEYPKKEVE